MHAGDRGGGAVVAIVERGSEHPAVPDERVIDGPGVDADAADLRLVACRGGKPAEHARVESVDVPVQAVVALDGPVGEPRDGPHAQLVVADVTEHDPAAGRAEVDRGDGGHHRSPPPTSSK